MILVEWIIDVVVLEVKWIVLNLRAAARYDEVVVAGVTNAVEWSIVSSEAVVWWVESHRENFQWGPNGGSLKTGITRFLS